MNGVFIPKGRTYPELSYRVATTDDDGGARAAAFVLGACWADVGVARCIGDAKARDGKRPHGAASIEVTVGPDGKVSSVKALTTELDAPLTGCVMGALEAATYPTTAVGASRYKLRLRHFLRLEMVEEATSFDNLHPDRTKLRLRANFPDLRRCWEHFAKRSGKGVDGWIRFGASVGEDGRISALQVTNSASFADKELLSCMAAVVTSIPFDPPSSAPGKFEYRLGFHPGPD
ncbi:MAG: hypothetical protein HYV09_15650 [Deltaproteobacteria bacterium]|nr:hypothetical protein [Deltaproteobacteria bacterium]